MSEKINDDVFEYEAGGMSQCISGFGHNTIELIRDELTTVNRGFAPDKEVMDRIAWHVEELVRWCRHFNGENKHLKGPK